MLWRKLGPEVVFSWNEGQSWYDFELSSMPVEVPTGADGRKRAIELVRAVFPNGKTFNGALKSKSSFTVSQSPKMHASCCGADES